MLNWIQQVALEGEAYKNEVFEIIGEENGHCIAPEDTWDIPDSEAVESDAGKEEVEDGSVKMSEGEECSDVASSATPEVKDVPTLEEGAEALKTEN